METYESSVTAEQLEKALSKSVFSVNGKNGDVSLDASDVNAVPLPSVAEVGQTIVVTAVDENGVPTAWEAADLAAGGGEWRKIYECSNVEVAEAVTALEIPLGVDSLGDITEFGLQLGLSKSTLGTDCNGRLTIRLDGGWIGYGLFNHTYGSSAYNLDIYGNYSSQELRFGQSANGLEWNLAQMYYQRKCGSHGSDSRDGLLYITFPAEWAGTYSVKVFTR